MVLMVLALVGSVSCAKKPKRPRPDEIQITAGFQTGGTELQGGLEQITGGLGGDSESTGGVSGNQGGSMVGGTSGDDVMGGAGGEPIDMPIAGEMGGSGG